MSPSEPGSLFHAEIAEQPAALERLLEHDAEIARIAHTARERRSELVRMVGHGSSDNAASYGVYAFGLLPRWTAMRDSITLTVHYDTPLDLSGSTVIGLSQSGRTPDVVEYVARARRSGAFTIAITNDPGSELASVAEATIPLEAGPELAVAATKTYVNTLAALALLAGHLAGEGAAVAEGVRQAAVAPRGLAARIRAVGGCAGAPLRLHGPDVRDRAWCRVCDGAGDRSQTARDLPGGRGAADRDRSRTRARRGARSALSRVGDSVSGCHVADGAGGGCSDPRDGRIGRRQWNGGGGDHGQQVRAAHSRDAARSACRHCSRSSPASCSPVLSRAPGVSTPTHPTG